MDEPKFIKSSKINYLYKAELIAYRVIPNIKSLNNNIAIFYFENCIQKNNIFKI